VNPGSREISAYSVSRFADGRVFIGLTFQDGTCHTLPAQSAADAMLMLDILRQEKPVYFDGYGTLFSGLEPVGESEAAPGDS